MSIRTKNTKQDLVSEGGEEEEMVVTEEVQSGIKDETVIFRAIGFLVVVVVLLGVYLRYIKPVSSVGKAQ
jgi:hypothetical protein